ncbi:hypothetical protein P3825_04555 [Pseudomonas aeruginosa]|nr:hypothetical protein [Pseudomonas aeruginosa]
MSIELNKESVEQADASSCQGTNCGTTTGDHSSECLAEAAAGQGWELKPGDLCGRDCPIHKISVEQAGGDERAALQELIRVRDWVKNRRGQPEKLKNTGQTYIMIEKCETLDMLEWAIERARAALAQPSQAQAEQAEAERPEVVARVDGTDEDWFIQPEDETELHNEGLLFAGCELGRMVDFDHIAGALRADRDSWAEQAEQRLADWDEMRKERDAALARVAELERQEPVVRAYGVLPPFAEKVLAKLRRFYDCAEDFESGGVDIGRHWLDLLTQLGLLNRVQRSPALWEISQHGEDLLEAPVAQAQHSVPEGWMLVPVEPLLNMMSDKDHDTRIMAERQLLSILSAAPGKEVGHE